MKLSQSPAISFEFFPPKTSEGTANLFETASVLAECHPHFFSVTYGAGGSTRQGTIETVLALKEKTKINVAPHLACVGSNREDILDVLRHYQAMGVKRLVALRGDLPSGMGQAGEIKYASELVSFIRETTGSSFHIEVAAYPEIHPQAVNAQDDVMNLQRKYEAGANSAITQYFFNPDAYFYYIEECAKRHIQLPIIPGIMPITQFSKLVRFSDACGAEIPRWIKKRLESYGDDVESIQSFGHEVIARLCDSLLRGGAPGLHFYTLNRSDATMNVLTSLNLISFEQKIGVMG